MRRGAMPLNIAGAQSSARTQSELGQETRNAASSTFIMSFLCPNPCHQVIKIDKTKTYNANLSLTFNSQIQPSVSSPFPSEELIRQVLSLELVPDGHNVVLHKNSETKEMSNIKPCASPTCHTCKYLKFRLPGPLYASLKLKLDC